MSGAAKGQPASVPARIAIDSQMVASPSTSVSALRSDWIFIQIGEALRQLMAMPLLRRDEKSKSLLARVALASTPVELCDRVADLHLHIKQLAGQADPERPSAARAEASGNPAKDGPARPSRNRLAL